MKSCIAAIFCTLLLSPAHAQTMSAAEWVSTITSNALTQKGQQVHPGYALYFAQAGDIRVPYIVYIPRGFNAAGHPPVVVFLHGAILARDSFHHKDPAIADEPVFAAADSLKAVVIFPFCQRGFAWPAQQAACDNVISIIGQVKQDYQLENSKVYLGGISMGGNATFWFINNKPDVFAGFYTFSAAPGSISWNYGNITKERPLISMHAKDDPVFSYDDAYTFYEQHKAEAPGWVFRNTDQGGHRFIYAASGYRYVIFALRHVIK